MNGRCKRWMLIVGAVACLSHVGLQARVVGSTSAVSIESSITFPAADSDNLIQGFAWLKNGLTLEDSLTTCTFDVVYPVSGNLDFRGGTIYLLQDLIGKNNMRIFSLGTIVGNNYAIDMASTVTYLPAGPCVLEDVFIRLNNDVRIDSEITVRGTCVLEASHHYVHVGDQGSITVDSGAHLIVRQADFQGISGTQLACVDDTASIELSNVALELDGDVTFSSGSLLFHNEVDIKGSYTFVYDSNCTSTIDAYTSVRIHDGTTLQIGRKKAVDYAEPLAFVDRTSHLVLNNCDLHVTATGMCITKGECVFGRNVNCYVDAHDKEHGIVLGDGETAHDAHFYYLPGCKIVMHRGALTYRNGSPVCIQSSAKNARLCRTENSYVFIDHDCLIDDITVELISDHVPAMVVADGASLSYKDAVVIASGVEFEITAIQVGEYTYCLCGDKLLSLTKGLLPAYIEIAGTGNIIEGTGSIYGPITFQADTAAQLIWRGDGYIINDLNLNGGTLTLENKLYFRANGAFTGPGTVNLGIASLVLCEKESQLVPPMLFIGQSGKVDFQEKLSLTSTCTFQGYCIVDGNNGVLELGEAAALVVAENSTLKLRDMTIIGVNTNNIRCLADSSVLELNNVHLVLDGDYTFDTGSMLYTNDVTLSGSHVFSYASKLTSTIDSYAALKFDQGLTCSLSRSRCDDAAGPIVFNDGSSAIVFDNSTLFVHTNGAKFTKGTVYCYRDCIMDVISTSSANGLIMGDGTAEGDMIFQFMPGSKVIYPRGHVVYDVTRPDGLQSNSETAAIVRYDESIFYLRHNCAVSQLTIDTTPYALFETENSSVLTYDKGVVATPYGAYKLTGSRYSTYANLLNGNQSLLMLEGYLAQYTLVDNAGNTLLGNGDVYGHVSLLSSYATLTWSLNGLMMNDIELGGGELTLTTNLNFTDDHFVQGPGTVHMNGKAIWCGESDLSITSTVYFDSNSAKSCIELHRDCALSACLTFSGEVCLNGNMATIDLGMTGELVVEQGSAFILKNATIKNVSGTNIRCLSDTSTIIFENVTLILRDDYLFEHGALDIDGYATIRGMGNIFVYRSPMPSVIEDNSRLQLDSTLTFSYDPSVPANNLLQFTDYSARLILGKATMHAACSAGLQFTRGEISIERDANFASDIFAGEGEAANPGITFGDGTAENDMRITLESGVNVHVLRGALNYKNISAESWLMHDYTSKWYMDMQTTLRLYQNIDLGDGYLFFGDGAVFACAPDKTITGATGQLGAFDEIILS